MYNTIYAILYNIYFFSILFFEITVQHFQFHLFSFIPALRWQLPRRCYTLWSAFVSWAYTAWAQQTSQFCSARPTAWLLSSRAHGHHGLGWRARLSCVVEYKNVLCRAWRLQQLLSLPKCGTKSVRRRSPARLGGQCKGYNRDVDGPVVRGISTHR